MNTNTAGITNRRTLVVSGILLLLSASGCLTSSGPPGGPNIENRFFDFVIPWDDTARTAIGPYNRLPVEAGNAGFIRVSPDGHLADDNGRIRFWGVNTCFGANFPSHEDAEKIAGHMAKFGINIVRFHHMDMQDKPGGIWTTASPDREPDKGQLDRLDYFIFQLKKHGIYSDLNLLVSRPFDRGKELHPDIEKVADWKKRAVIGIFDPALIELQKRYAYDLLTHTNPYTASAYKDEPAIAFIEINNENGLIHAYLGGQLDGLPPYYHNELNTGWNDWLLKKYGNHEALERAWHVSSVPRGENMLSNGDFSGPDIIPWNCENHDTAKAAVTPGAFGPEGRSGVKIIISKTGSQSWHVQFNQAGLSVKKDLPYSLGLKARADRERTISVAVNMAHAPWQGLGFQTDIVLSKEWKEYRFPGFLLHTSDPEARLNFGNMGSETGTVWIADVSLSEGGTIGMRPVERLETGTIESFSSETSWGRTEEGRKDWLRFLRETEKAYWLEMRDYIKETCGAASIVFGTIIGCSTPNLMAEFDMTDSHAYWCHPSFPHRAWDARDWYVENRCMINHPASSTVADLAMKAVAGLPHAVTEYNHSHPNTFQAETFFLLSAYASLQDWDVVIPFTWSHRTDQWDIKKIPNYFDIDQNPVKLASFVPASRAFLEYHIKPAADEITVPFSSERELDLLLEAHAWKLADASSAGVETAAALVHRIRMKTGESGVLPETPSATGDEADVTVFRSDTGEIVWDAGKPGKGVLTVDTPESVYMAGFIAGMSFSFSGMTIRPGETIQNGFSCIALTLLEGPSLEKPSRLLITALGAEDNHNTTWYTYPGTPVSFPPGEGLKVTLKNRYGDPPSMVEGVPLHMRLPHHGRHVHVWALDETGGRKREVNVTSDGDYADFSAGPEYKTVWYEVEFE